MIRMQHLVLALAVTALASRADAQAPAKRALAVEDYYDVKAVGAPEISPDGKWVAFTVATRVEATNALRSDVRLVPFDASAAPRRVSADGVNATTPSWTSDGRLHFVTDGVAFTLDPADPERVDSTDAPSARSARTAVAPQVSPDGKWIATVANTPLPPHPRSYASDFERRHEERFKGVQFDWMEFHRDGGPYPIPNATDPQVNPPQEIFLSASGDDEKSARALTHLAVRPMGLQWSPDGTALLFSADSAYRNERVYGRTDVFTVSLDGTVRRLTPSTENDYNGARYSPDGKWILASRELSTDAVIAQKLDHGGPNDLVVLPASGGPERVLTADWDYLPVGPRWSPDGKFVYFTGGVGGTTHLFRVPAAGGDVQQVTSGQRRLAAFSFDRTFGRMAYTVATFETPTEIWASNADGTNAHQLTHVNDQFLHDVAVNRAERLQFRSADGTPVEGWVTLPDGYRAGVGRYPLVVSNHGGPHSAIEYGYSFRNQYLAANGYFVLEVNFRSSTNYGEKFLWATWGAWGTKDGQDVMAGIDYAISKYPIDRTKIATIGHSYGGFMTNWLITQYPDRFAAAISGAGIVNWMSDYGNADIPRTKETEFFGAPWEERAREIMIRQSPLTYANRAKAPTLFINGDADQRVPVSEAQQMFVALKKNGVPAKMIQYAGQPHGIAGSWNIVHRMINERQWLDRWMKAGGAQVP